MRERVRPGGAGPCQQEREALRDEPCEEGARQHGQLSLIHIFIPTNEEYMIARDTYDIVHEQMRVEGTVFDEEPVLV